ncbi:hypothetical protein HHI36_007976, partial [Cryptolaemus montrouzieri]
MLVCEIIEKYCSRPESTSAGRPSAELTPLSNHGAFHGFRSTHEEKIESYKMFYAPKMEIIAANQSE